MNKHEKFLMESVEFAKMQLLEKGELTPMFIANSLGVKLIISTPWQSEEHKQAIVSYVKGLFIVQSVDEYIFMSEMWFKPVKSFNKEDMPKGFVADEPDKKEGMMVVQGWLEDGKFGRNNRMFETHRENGKVRLEDLNFGQEVDGTFANLLSDIKPSPGELEILKTFVEVFEKRLNIKREMHPKT